MCIQQFHQVFYKNLSTRLMRACLDDVASERIGSEIDVKSMSGVTSSLIVIGKSEDLYISDFESPFLKETLEFYSIASKKDMEYMDYLLFVEKCFDEESKRTLHYLLPRSRNPLNRICVETLVESRYDHLISYFSSWMENQEIEHLKRLFAILSRSESSFKNLLNNFEKIIEKDGLTELEKCTDATSLVEIILKIYEKFSRVITSCMPSNPVLLFPALTNGCKKFINSEWESKCPDYLVTYCHNILVQSREESELEPVLSSLSIIYKLLQDKDIFHKLYSHYLSQRLIYSKSSIEKESFVLKHLKEISSFEKIYKDQRMLNDIQLSSDMKLDFGAKLNGIDFDALILTTGSWPVQIPPISLNLPDMILKSCTTFGEYYVAKHQGRKLNWLHYLSNGVVSTHLSKLNPNSYDIQVSSIQLLILLLFNDHDQLTIENLLEMTGLSLKDIATPLSVVCKSKLLISENKEGNFFDNKNIIALNQDFSSNFVKLNLFASLQKKRQDVVTQGTMETIFKERNYVLQATIVRIMKIKKLMSHQDLVTSVISQIELFLAKPFDIKVNIDTLIDKEFIKRDEMNSNLYHYV